MTSLTAPPLPDGWVRWRIAILLFFVTVINYIDRLSLSIAAPVLMDELALSKTEYGYITSAFLLTYAIGQGLSGRVIDRLGAKRAFTIAVTFWSLAAAAQAFGRGVVSFMGIRAVLGAFESANHPTAVKVIATWFPRAEKSMAVGIFLAGASAGAIVAPLVLGFMIHYFSWQFAFIAAGAVGFVWLIFWRRVYYEPEDHPRLSTGEREYIIEGRGSRVSQSSRPSIWKLLKHKEVAGLMLARFFGDNIFTFYATWLPVYLASERGLDILGIAAFAWIPFLFTDAGSLAAGWVGQKLIRLGFSVDASRKIMLWTAAVLVPFSVLSIFVDQVALAVLLIGVAMFFNQFKSVVVVGLPADLFPARDVATVWGWLGAAGSFGGFIFAPIIGWTAENYSFLPVFIAVACLPALSATLVTLFIPRVREIVVNEEPAVAGS